MKFVRIKDIMSVNRGSSPRPISNTAYFSETGTYGWVRISDVTKSDKHLFNTEERLSDLGASFSVKLDKPTLFLSIAGSVGKACINKIPVCIHDGFVYFSSIKNYDINYLFWFFSNSIIYEGLGKKGVFLNLNIDTIKNILIPKLKIDEQLKISKFLDTHCSKIDSEVLLLQQKSILLDEYKNALIYETVTKGLDKNAVMKDSGVEWMGDVPSHWNIRRIKSFVKSLKTGKEDASHSDEDGVYDFYTCSVKNFKCNDFKFEGSAILLAGNGDISNIKHLKAKNSKFNAYQRVYILQKIKNNERYLYYSFKAGFVNSVRHKQKGSVIEFIKLQDITNFEILDFDINEQTKISNFLDIETAKIEKQIELINKKVELLKEYKQSLIYEAVTGQLEIE